MKYEIVFKWGEIKEVDGVIAAYNNNGMIIFDVSYLGGIAQNFYNQNEIVSVSCIDSSKI